MKKTKFNKDQIQKIVLTSIGFFALIYCYINFFLGPLKKSRATMTQTIAELQDKTASSRTELKKTANLELQAKAATGRYDALKSMTEDGAPIAWFPPKMRSFFASQGIDKAAARLEATAPYQQPELSDWIKHTWAIELPQSDYNELGTAVAALENAEPLLAVQKLVIHAVPEEPQYQQISLIAQLALYKK
jgi:hypothetical protein